MSTPNRSWLRIGSCLAILTIVAVTALVVTIPAGYLGRKIEDERRFLKPFRTPFDSEAFFNYCGDYASNSSERNDVVFFGDSTCLSGIEISEFQRQTGLAAHNLGTIGMIGMEGFCLLMQTYLEHHPAPRVAVLCVLPNEVGPPLTVRKAAGAANGSRSKNITERFFWCFGKAGSYPRPSHPSPVSYYVSQGLLTILGYLQGGERHYLDTPAFNLGDRSYNNLTQDLVANRGYLSFKESGSLAPTELRDPLSGVFFPAEGATADDPFPVSPAIDNAVRKLARLAADKGVLLMIRLSPELQSAKPEHFDRIQAWFDRLESECPQIVCDRPEVLLYGPEYFADENHHLNLRGTQKFTELLASKVSRLLGKNTDDAPTSPAQEHSTSRSISEAE